MFKWRKKGQIWAPSLANTWMQEYGQNANALILEDRIRVFFSSRRKSYTDGKYMSYIFSLDVERNDPSKILAIREKPILNPTGKGDVGTFDEFGSMPGSVVWRADKGELWLYYVGWQRCESLPYKWANGIAVSKDGGLSFEKLGDGPIISRPYEYPYLHACPRVLYHPEKGWRMWYASGVEWFEHDGRMNPIYVIMGASSKDGLLWDLSGRPTIAAVGKKECQSSASIIEYGGVFHMFFSYRDVIPNQDKQKQYRVGYAWSNDLTNWQRDDAQAGIEVSPSGWDSEAICYPHVVEVDDRILMFYSGNQYGRSGFGYAELVA
jgi:predicted GH43/DUF377 family glycosyl hydrolase